MKDFGRFLTKQKPLCLGLPFYKALVSANLYYKLSERSEMDFNGRNLFEQGCPNARICDEECLGRPIPKYPELVSIVAKYDPTEGMWNDKPVWFLKVDTCKTCPFKAECTKVCPSMNAFDSRNKNRDDYFLELASPIEDLDDEWLEKLYAEEEGEVWHNQMQLTGSDIAWDCLTEPQRAAVMLVEVQGLTHDQAASKLGIYKRSVQTSHESGMDRLKEYGMARRALKEDSSCPYSVDYYLNCKGIAEIADNNGISTGLVHKRLDYFRNKYHLKG